MKTERFDELEARIAMMDDLLDTLNRTVFDQQRQIESLQQQLRHLYQQMQSSQQTDADRSADAPDPRQDIPPHW
ncbi:SlyX family protein [Methyloversatilis sp. XJ19-13]|uniref:SlyX family protein n=1 Tax=Methyloversatilis sp. XJ19-13 TaxID=2963430 RepID=UPI00211CF5D9|nr:SlyX family protein [Methyloversatilis sp. XJ19-13]MCQ9374720.1 SlyX family protein [Methyloversatilis sp. XJ19-13]